MADKGHDKQKEEEKAREAKLAKLEGQLTKLKDDLHKLLKGYNDDVTELTRLIKGIDKTPIYGNSKMSNTFERCDRILNDLARQPEPMQKVIKKLISDAKA